MTTRAEQDISPWGRIADAAVEMFSEKVERHADLLARLLMR